MLSLFVSSPVSDNQPPFTLLLFWNDEGPACPLSIGGFNSTTLNTFHQEVLHRFHSFPLEFILPVTINLRVRFQLHLGRTKISRDPEDCCWQIHYVAAEKL